MAVAEELYSVTCLTSGRELLELLRTRTPDLILLDLSMPAPDGMDTFRSMKKDHTKGTLPVIFLTGSSNPEAESACLKLGALDFIRKPFPPEGRMRC